MLRNGSYLVFRQLSQDVGGFWRFADGATRRADGSSDPDARLRLAAKMVGRWPSGAPLALAPDADDPSLAEANDFAYHANDPRGARCPVGSHIRRSNPRDSLDPNPGSEGSFEINRRHRILRRGREYGPALPLERALAEPDSAERGLHFICLNANLARQFEFVHHTWLNNRKFGIRARQCAGRRKGFRHRISKRRRHAGCGGSSSASRWAIWSRSNSLRFFSLRTTSSSTGCSIAA